MMMSRVVKTICGIVAVVAGHEQWRGRREDRWTLDGAAEARIASLMISYNIRRD